MLVTLQRCKFGVVRYADICKVETPIHDSIMELVAGECKEHGSEVMNVLSKSERKCWELKSEFLEASAILHKCLKQGCRVDTYSKP